MSSIMLYQTVKSLSTLATPFDKQERLEHAIKTITNAISDRALNGFRSVTIGTNEFKDEVIHVEMLPGNRIGGSGCPYVEFRQELVEYFTKGGFLCRSPTQANKNILTISW